MRASNSTDGARAPWLASRLKRAYKRGPLGRRGGKSSVWIIVLVVCVVWPLSHPQPFYLDVASLSALYLLLAIGMNIVMGWTGMLHLGYVALYGVGAYVTGHLMLRYNIGFWWALLGSICAGALISIFIGVLTLKHRGDYFLVITLAFLELFSLGVQNWVGVTGGIEGLYGVPPASLAGQQIVGSTRFYYFVLAFAVAGVAIALVLRRSAIMQSWLFVRGDEFAAEVIGINAVRAKLTAVVVAGVYATVAGALLTVDLSTVSPASFTFSQTVTIVLCVLIGGMGSLGGLLLGVILIVAVPDLISLNPEYQLVAFGILLILIVMVRPSGLFSVRFGLPQVRSYVARRRANEGVSSQTDSPVAPFSVPSEARHANKPIGPTSSAMVDSTPDISNSVLELRNICVRFGGVDALSELNLTLRSGDILGMIGPNGSGKTTALNAVCGIVVPWQGDFELDGSPWKPRKPHYVPRAGIARTFQHTRLFLELSVLDNVRAGMFDDGSLLRSLLVQKETRRVRAELDEAWASLDFVDPSLASQFADRNVGELSFAQRRWVEIARALSSHPRVILLDEPASGLDLAERVRLVDVINRVRASGTAVWLVEHDMDFVEAVSNRVIALVGGRKVAEGHARAVMTNPLVVEAYIGTGMT